MGLARRAVLKRPEAIAGSPVCSSLMQGVRQIGVGATRRVRRADHDSSKACTEGIHANTRQTEPPLVDPSDRRGSESISVSNTPFASDDPGHAWQ